MSSWEALWGADVQHVQGLLDRQVTAFPRRRQQSLLDVAHYKRGPMTLAIEQMYSKGRGVRFRQSRKRKI